MPERVVHSMVDLEVVDDPEERKRSPAQKPFLRLTASDGTVLEITTNVGEMIGGAAQGARERWEMLTKARPEGRG